MPYPGYLNKQGKTPMKREEWPGSGFTAGHQGLMISILLLLFFKLCDLLFELGIDLLLLPDELLLFLDYFS